MVEAKVSPSSSASRQYRHTPSTTSSRPAVLSHLILHNSLLKPWPNHSLRPGFLTPTPNPLPIRRLHHPPLLSLRGALLQDKIARAFRGGRERVGGVGVHGGVRGSRVRVVGWDGVVGAAGGGRGAEGGGCCGGRAVGGGAQGAEGGSLEHCCRRRGGLNGWWTSMAWLWR